MSDDIVERDGISDGTSATRFSLLWFFLILCFFIVITISVVIIVCHLLVVIWTIINDVYRLVMKKVYRDIILQYILRNVWLWIVCYKCCKHTRPSCLPCAMLSPLCFGAWHYYLVCIGELSFEQAYTLSHNILSNTDILLPPSKVKLINWKSIEHCF